MIVVHLFDVPAIEFKGALHRYLKIFGPNAAVLNNTIKMSLFILIMPV